MEQSGNRTDGFHSAQNWGTCRGFEPPPIDELGGSWASNGVNWPAISSQALSGGQTTMLRVFSDWQDADRSVWQFPIQALAPPHLEARFHPLQRFKIFFPPASLPPFSSPPADRENLRPRHRVRWASICDVGKSF